jgi:hypothetical protein
MLPADLVSSMCAAHAGQSAQHFELVRGCLKASLRSLCLLTFLADCDKSGCRELCRGCYVPLKTPKAVCFEFNQVA